MSAVLTTSYHPKSPAMPSSLPCECQRMIRQTKDLFEETLSSDGEPVRAVSDDEKTFNENGIREALDDLGLALLPWQGTAAGDLTEEDKNQMADLISNHLLRIDVGRYLFDEPFLSFFLDHGYLGAAREFSARAQETDGALTSEETFQAMRNVWIMNSLQLMWDLPLSVTPSVYGYSMLYPYTDNFLDDPSVSKEEKGAFNEMVLRSLNGERVESPNPSAARIQELIGMIRTQYPEESFPDVISSIKLIQAAQTMSVRQDHLTPLGEEELKLLSFYKGGASVLADGYLVKGNLSGKEMEFAFYYGSFLQLVDDLQDARADLAQGHQTLYSTKIRENILDEQILHLTAFIARINRMDEEDAPMMRYMKNIIGTCSRLMVFDVLGRDPSLVTPAFYEKMERSSKVRLAFFKEIADRLESLMKFQGTDGS